MAGPFNLFGWGEKVSKPIYSMEHLQHLYNRLQQIKEDEQNREAMVEVIRQITETLIWGEQNGHDHDFFDFFCEKNVLADFVRVLGLQRMPKTVKVQLLQTLSMLVQNIRRDTSLYYLFSNNYVNQLISTQFDWNDEEILGYYISFLKSLSLRLNGETIKFFFNEHSEQFPLYIEAIRFFRHHDQMVRTATRTLTLRVYRLEDVGMRRFVLERSWSTYFVHLACHLRELWLKLDTFRERPPAGESALKYLQDVSEQHQDLLMYISDVLSMEVPALSEALVERLLQYALLPVLVGSLCFPATPEPDDGASAAVAPAAAQASARGDRLSPACALFVLHQVLDCCGRTGPLLEPLVAALLLPHPPRVLLGACAGPIPPPPPTYHTSTADVSGPASTEAPPAVPVDAGLPGGPRGPGLCYALGAAMASGRRGPNGEAEAMGATGSEAPPVRGRFLAHLTGPSDACALLVAGILSACLGCGGALPQALLVGAGLLPEADGHQPDGDGGGAVLPVVVQALERHSSLRIVAIQALVAVASTLLARAPEQGGTGWHEPALTAARRALRAAARQVRTYLQGPSADGFIDTFAEEWAMHNLPPTPIKEACSSIRCLLPAPSASTAGCPVEWTFPHSDRQHVAKAVRALLLIRSLATSLLRRLGPERDLDDHLQEAEELARTGGAAVNGRGCVPTGPLHIPEEVVDGYMEQKSFELGRQDRIVCAIATSEGRATRYLVLHPFLLLLVQPDLVSPGWAIVRTLAPVRAVETRVDSADSRTLRLAVRLPKGSPAPNEASPFDAGGAEPTFSLPAEEHRGSSFFMLTLSFEDVKRCQCADLHLRKRRQEVRAQMRKRVEAFVDGLCS